MTKRPTRLSLTPWFPASVKPIRNGVYQVETISMYGRCYAMWNGRSWLECKRSIKGAAGGYFESWWQSRKWRGLAKSRRKS